MLIMETDFLCAEIIIFQNSSMSLCWHWVLMNFLGLFQLNCSIQSYVHPSFFKVKSDTLMSSAVLQLSKCV